jgi:hypothetical protein
MAPSLGHLATIGGLSRTHSTVQSRSCLSAIITLHPSSRTIFAATSERHAISFHPIHGHSDARQPAARAPQHHNRQPLAVHHACATRRPVSCQRRKRKCRPSSNRSQAAHLTHSVEPNATQLKQVVNRPEITPLFLFTGGIVCLALFFGSRHLLKDKELRLDHAQQNRLKTQTEQLDFDAMKHVAEDPEGKLTKQAIDEERERGKRLEQIKQEKEDKANKKL